VPDDCDALLLLAIVQQNSGPLCRELPHPYSLGGLIKNAIRDPRLSNKAPSLASAIHSAVCSEGVNLPRPTGLARADTLREAGPS
jgi:hypothetical protein